MPRYIAFLRAINVGGHVVKMDQLKRLFEELGFQNVETFIASGNVIFETSAPNAGALERKIESHLRSALGYEVATFVRSAPELAAVAGYRPFPDAELDNPENTVYIGFLRDGLKEAARAQLAAFQTETYLFHHNNRELYMLCRTRFSDSGFSGAALEKAIGVPTTMRKETTVRKMAAKYPADTKPATGAPGSAKPSRARR
ncbi:MAG TPA: DUF1697 domain-containing protein [Candidatus Kapabacteria bacterium]|nr:DUF1697 domain-containing protein [Candidatus Kapabacteria bacterium]